MKERLKSRNYPESSLSFGLGRIEEDKEPLFSIGKEKKASSSARKSIINKPFIPESVTPYTFDPKSFLSDVDHFDPQVESLLEKLSKEKIPDPLTLPEFNTPNISMDSINPINLSEIPVIERADKSMITPSLQELPRVISRTQSRIKQGSIIQERGDRLFLIVDDDIRDLRGSSDYNTFESDFEKEFGKNYDKYSELYMHLFGRDKELTILLKELQSRNPNMQALKAHLIKELKNLQKNFKELNLTTSIIMKDKARLKDAFCIYQTEILKLKSLRNSLQYNLQK